MTYDDPDDDDPPTYPPVEATVLTGAVIDMVDMAELVDEAVPLPCIEKKLYDPILRVGVVISTVPDVVHTADP